MNRSPRRCASAYGLSYAAGAVVLRRLGNSCSSIWGVSGSPGYHLQFCCKTCLLRSNWPGIARFLKLRPRQRRYSRIEIDLLPMELSRTHRVLGIQNLQTFDDSLRSYLMCSYLKQPKGESLSALAGPTAAEQHRNNIQTA